MPVELNLYKKRALVMSKAFKVDPSKVINRPPLIIREDCSTVEQTIRRTNFENKLLNFFLNLINKIWKK